ncbi:MAG: hypothetical protein ACRCZZ_10965 [Phocaeicola sp.]
MKYQVTLTDHGNIEDNFTFNSFSALRSTLISECNKWIQSEYDNMGYEDCDYAWISDFELLIRALTLSSNVDELKYYLDLYPSNATITIF